MEKRFAFGKNWASYLEVLNEVRVQQAQSSIQQMLQVSELNDLSFLDIGCGSGIFSLAAWKLGAHVTSFDYDSDSVSCTQHLRSTFGGDESVWKVCQGSVLDQSFMRELPVFDVVYAWGVLHHTGNMWEAIKSACHRVKPRGKLFLSIYNRLPDRNHRAVCRMKRSYVNASPIRKRFILAYYGSRMLFAEILSALLQGKHPFATVIGYDGDSRGMSFLHDTIDWIGGYPYEAARPEEVFDFCLAQGFQLRRLSTNTGHGCNQFVFERLT